jgi:hypothetical protein
MNQRIIFPNNEGGVSILVPSPNWQGTMEELAAKDVPAGKPYQIVDVSDIPTDRAFRGAWEFVADEPVEETVDNEVTE